MERHIDAIKFVPIAVRFGLKFAEIDVIKRAFDQPHSLDAYIARLVIIVISYEYTYARVRSFLVRRLSYRSISHAKWSLELLLHGLYRTPKRALLFRLFLYATLS